MCTEGNTGNSGTIDDTITDDERRGGRDALPQKTCCGRTFYHFRREQLTLVRHCSEEEKERVKLGENNRMGAPSAILDAKRRNNL